MLLKLVYLSLVHYYDKIMVQKKKTEYYKFTCARFNPWRDEEGRHPNPETVEHKIEVVTYNIIWAGHTDDWSWYMVIEPTMLVICYDEQHLIPLRA